MKRKFGLSALALTLTAVLAGCGGTTSEATPTPSAPAVAPTDSPEPSVTPSPVIPSATPDTEDQAGDNARRYDGGMWTDGDDAMDDAGDVMRGAVDGARDATRGFIDGMDDMARGIENSLGGSNQTATDSGSRVPGREIQRSQW